MFVFTGKTIVYVFKFLCFAATFFMTGYWCVHYFQDHDLSLVDYGLMKDVENPKPTFTLCFINPILEDKLKEIHPNLNRSLYLQFLKGDIDHDILSKINYENVTLDIRSQIRVFNIDWRNGSRSFSNDTYIQNVMKIHVAYSGFQNRFLYKCVGIEIKPAYKEEIKSYKLYLQKGIFRIYPGGYRPSTGLFSTRIHYPSHFVLSYETAKYGWPIRNNGDAYYMRFGIKMIEVLRRRNKNNKPCIPKSKSYDSVVMESALNEAGCRAPYQTSFKHFPFCKGREKIKMSMLVAERKFHMNDIYPPCEEIVDIEYNYSELEYSPETLIEWDQNFIVLAVGIPDKIKIIQHSREISFHALVGNTGGYIGLFLGMLFIIVIDFY